jgi:hypothetical protein
VVETRNSGVNPSKPELQAVNLFAGTRRVVLSLLALALTLQTPVIGQSASSVYGPREESGYTIDPASVKVDGGGQVELPGFLSDFVTYSKYIYTSESRVFGPCGQPLAGSVSESVNYSLSFGMTFSSGQKATAGSSGSVGPGLSSSLSSEVSFSLSQSLGITVGGSDVHTMQYVCAAHANFRAIAVFSDETTEYSGTYTDWHFFSGTNYEFHAHHREIRGYDCQYQACKVVVIPSGTSVPGETPR